MHNPLLVRTKKIFFYISALIFTFPIVLSASRPAAAAAEAGLSSRALAQGGEFTHTAVGSKRHNVQSPEDKPASKKQKGEDEALPFQYTQADHKVLLDTVTEALINNDVTYVQTILDNPSAKDVVQEDLENRDIYANTPAMAQVLANAGFLTFKNEALVFACRSSRHCPEVVQWHIDHGSLVDGTEENPLLRYIQCSPNSNTPGHPKVKILLQAGALLCAYSNNILQKIKELERRNRHKAQLLTALQEIRLLLKQHSDYRHKGIYQDLAVCRPTPMNKKFLPLSEQVKRLIAQYYVAQEPTYEELLQKVD